MASYSTPTYSSGKPARTGMDTVTVLFGILDVSVALATNDTINLCKIPAGAQMIDVAIMSAGTQGANSDSTFTVGDSGDTDRFITTAGGLALRSGGGVSRMNGAALSAATTGIGYEYTADTDLVMTITAQGTGQTTGGRITGYAQYRMK